MYEIFGIEMNIWGYALLFLVCQFINVALNTIKTIIMHKEEKISSAIINAITYGFYTIIVVMTASDLPLWLTIVITIITNLFGVYVSMVILEKFKKDSLWEIHATVDGEYTGYVADELDALEIDYIDFKTRNGKEIFHIYSRSQADSKAIKEVLDSYGAKYNVCEERVKL